MQIGLSGKDYGIIASACLIMFFVSFMQERSGSVREKLWQKPVALRWAVFFGIFLIILLMGSYGFGYDASSFIYNRF